MKDRTNYWNGKLNLEQAHITFGRILVLRDWANAQESMNVAELKVLEDIILECTANPYDCHQVIAMVNTRLDRIYSELLDNK